MKASTVRDHNSLPFSRPKITGLFIDI